MTDQQLDLEAARTAANVAHPVHVRSWLREAADEIDRLRAERDQYRAKFEQLRRDESKWRQRAATAEAENAELVRRVQEAYAHRDEFMDSHAELPIVRFRLREAEANNAKLRGLLGKADDVLTAASTCNDFTAEEYEILRLRGPLVHDLDTLAVMAREVLEAEDWRKARGEVGL